MTGKWKSYALDPEIARDEYRPLGALARREFTAAEFTLREDHSYHAEVSYGPDVNKSHGTWERRGEKLTFVDADGAAFTFDYPLEDSDATLKLTRRMEGTAVVLTLRRIR